MLLLRALWRLRPRPWYAPWRSLPYYRWRVETLTGIPASAVTWRVSVRLLRQRCLRLALWRYLDWIQTFLRKGELAMPMDTPIIVPGDHTARSLAAFITACEVHMLQAQAKVPPETTLMALLDESIRLAKAYAAREYTASASLLLSEEITDAGRYRHLRAYSQGTSLAMDGTQYWHVPSFCLGSHKTRTFDEAVDRAIMQNHAKEEIS